MSTATLTSKGQITIPAEVRHDLKVDAGDRVEFVQIAPGRYEFVAATSEVTALKGMFGVAKKAVTIESMNAAIAPRARRTASPARGIWWKSTSTRQTAGPSSAFCPTRRCVKPWRAACESRGSWRNGLICRSRSWNGHWRITGMPGACPSPQRVAERGKRARERENREYGTITTGAVQ